MLQGRVIRPISVGVALMALLAACGGAAPRPIETLERTGVTAIEQSKALACNGDAEVLRQAIEVYSELEGHPPADEAALVAAQDPRGIEAVRRRQWTGRAGRGRLRWHGRTSAPGYHSERLAADDGTVDRSRRDRDVDRGAAHG